MENEVKQVRCAIYTRKSTDENLNSEFNSLDAQREACENYILEWYGYLRSSKNRGSLRSNCHGTG